MENTNEVANIHHEGGTEQIENVLLPEFKTMSLVKNKTNDKLTTEQLSEDSYASDDCWDDSDDIKYKGRPERWAPLGANDSDKDYSSNCGNSEDTNWDPVELQKMREDQERLTSALFALTTHFAQVQFRVQQIVAAPQYEREGLLKELEEFTFRGIPTAVTENLGADDPEKIDHFKEKMKAQREKQKDLIVNLKRQLEELESYAYETGEAGVPQRVLLERHQLVVEQLKSRLNLNVDELEKLSEEDIKLQVDQAINELINPLKMKEELVTQLKAQITDLERFIQYLHDDNTQDGACNCIKNIGSSSSMAGPSSQISNSSNQKREMEHEAELRAKTIQMMRKALTLIQMFAVSQFGCSSQFKVSSLNKFSKGSHWGDLRASLEIAISKVYDLATQTESPLDSDYTSDSDDSPTLYCNRALTTAVRKELAVALSNLLEHGLTNKVKGRTLVPFASCFAASSSQGSGFLTSWDLILKYYRVKNGEKYNATPARRLSQSFGLEIVGATAITNKQMLLSTIDNIISSHSRYKRSPQSHFKALVCAALNCKKLVTWLRLIVRCQVITEHYYEPWSYVAKTGFEDALKSLDKLSSINFELPVDLAIRQFQNIKDVFQ